MLFRRATVGEGLEKWYFTVAPTSKRPEKAHFTVDRLRELVAKRDFFTSLTVEAPAKWALTATSRVKTPEKPHFSPHY
jgi:hypothetical protein